MVDVFVRTVSGQNPLRHAFFEATKARWQMEPEVNLRWVVDMPIRAGRLAAEKEATSDPYIFTDDDVLPWGKNWVRMGVTRMLMNPQFAVASTRSVIAEEMGNYQIPDGVEVFDIPAVGAPMWIRKGIIGPDIRDFLFVEECIEIDNYVKRKGFKSGIITGIQHLHLGFGFATDPKLVRGY